MALSLPLRLIFIFSIFKAPFAYSNAESKDCVSYQNREIVSFDFKPRATGSKKRILVLAGMHGDEPQAHQLGLLWLERLEKIKTPSNHWRVIPLVNPDGFQRKTRSNSRDVDLNRNFPTKDWDEKAISLWTEKLKKNPRRFPGTGPGSEIETQCVLKHIEEFNPDLVVSIHTPYGQFDFDGPADKRLNSNLLPWKQIGTFPGSLGRYLWDERKVPVLTIELKPDSLQKNTSGFIKLQDLLSYLL